jgi:hypothetical protein
MSRARHLRKNSTPQERLLWRQLAIGIWRVGNFGGNIRSSLIYSIFTARRRVSQSSLMAVVTILQARNLSIRKGQDFSRAKVLLSCDFGIPGSPQSWIAFLKLFGQRSSSGRIPHLNPLPSRKGEAKRLACSLPAAVFPPLTGGERIEVRGELVTPRTVKNRSARFSGFRFLPSL